MCVALTK